MRKLKNSELDRKSVKEFRESGKYPVIVVLDNIRSLNNVGAVFRTSDSFLIEGMYLCGITARPPHREIHKTALGATDSIYWEYFESTLDAVAQLKERGYTVISIEQAEGSHPLPEFKLRDGDKYALVFGHEVKGVQQAVVDRSDYCIEIPQYGTKHSFNISVSVGIVLYHFYYHLYHLKPNT